MLGGLRPQVAALLGAVMLLAVSGCQEAPALPASDTSKQPEAQTIREGDMLKITFPGAANMDTSQQVRRDGRITLGVIGELVVVGQTPAELEKTLASKYAGQLLSSEVDVTIVSSTFTVFVSGAVLHPGKVSVDHSLTALEAVMEAGGYDTTKADMSNVTVVRQEGGGTKNYHVDLAAILDGRSGAAFYLKPFDILIVPSKFSWF